MELYFWETPQLVPQFFAYRRQRLELWKDVRIGFCVETYLGNSIFSPLTSQYLLSLLMFVVQHKDLFITSMDNHNLETRQSNNLCTPQVNLSVYQKGAYYSGVKIFNKLPSNIKNVNGNITKFKTTLKRFLYVNSFYTLEEYFEQ
jgi:hypothetical protein